MKKPIKRLTTEEIEEFERLTDRKHALMELLEKFGYDDRAFWNGLRKKYGLSHAHTIGLNKKTGVLTEGLAEVDPDKGGSERYGEKREQQR